MPSPQSKSVRCPLTRMRRLESQRLGSGNIPPVPRSTASIISGSRARLKRPWRKHSGRRSHPRSHGVAPVALAWHAIGRLPAPRSRETSLSCSDAAAPPPATFQIVLPLPPGVNNQYVSVGRRRVLSAPAKTFNRDVAKLIAAQRTSGRLSTATEQRAGGFAPRRLPRLFFRNAAPEGPRRRSEDLLGRPRSHYRIRRPRGRRSSPFKKDRPSSPESRGRDRDDL